MTHPLCRLLAALSLAYGTAAAWASPDRQSPTAARLIVQPEHRGPLTCDLPPVPVAAPSPLSCRLDAPEGPEPCRETHRAVAVQSRGPPVPTDTAVWYLPAGRRA